MIISATENYWSLSGSKLEIQKTLCILLNSIEERPEANAHGRQAAQSFPLATRVGKRHQIIIATSSCLSLSTKDEDAVRMSSVNEGL